MQYKFIYLFYDYLIPILLFYTICGNIIVNYIVDDIINILVFNTIYTINLIFI